MIRYFADECVAQSIVDGLRQQKLDVVAARDICLGDTDDRALALATATERVVIPDDKGFGELAVRQQQPAIGVIVLSLHQLSAGHRDTFAVERIVGLGERAIGALTIIEPGPVRTRPLNDRS